MYIKVVADKKWKWTNDCQKAFHKANDALVMSEMLTYCNPALLVQLACNVSPYGVRVVVLHVLPYKEDRPMHLLQGH